MGGTADKVSGRVKEAAGSLTGDEQKKEEGRLQQFAGDVKEKSEQLADRAKDAVEGIVDKVKDAGSKDDSPAG